MGGLALACNSYRCLVRPSAGFVVSLGLPANMVTFFLESLSGSSSTSEVQNPRSSPSFAASTAIWYADGTEKIVTLKQSSSSSAMPINSQKQNEQNGFLSPTGKTPLDESHTPKQLMLHTGSVIKSLSATELASEIHESTSPQKIYSVDSSAAHESRVLVLYTGGTIGMRTRDGVYYPEPYYLPQAIRELPHLNDKEYVEQNYSGSRITPYALPMVRHMKKRIVYWVVEYEPVLDSSDMTFDDWIRIAQDIRKSYNNYDGFVVLHGTDTLAYTACALSFMMENLGKPVVITGAQIPVAEVRSDGRENLIGALIVAGNFDIPEVTVYFNNKLLRGNRSTKVDNSALEAFTSPNMAPIAEMEIQIKIHWESVFRSSCIAPFTVHDKLCRNVGVLRIFPSISIQSVRAALMEPVEGVVLQSFGAGNMPSRRKDIIEEIQKAINRGVLVVNCSQCVRGQVDSHYFTGKILYDIGVIPGSDMTTEAALTKLSYVLGKEEWDLPTKAKMLQRNIRGELTVATTETLHEIEIFPRLAKYLRISSSHENELLRNALLPPLVCHAAATGDVDLLDSLKESGVTFSMSDYDMRTALHVASAAGHLRAVNYLLQHGASVHSRDSSDDNALMCAIKAKKIDCIKALRSAGAIIVASPSSIGMSLCLAASQHDLQTLQAWREGGATLMETDYDGRTALHVAIPHKNEELIHYLCEEGCDPMHKDNYGMTPMKEAESLGLEDIVDVLQHAVNKKERDLGGAGIVFTFN
ncbi:hypothetical protein L596_023146 [Steinernema carpocapsae]|uniref:asparaginase n=1 Tax=Steinernema carpocapsae TaxID=34508 RepID=A0A4U5MCU2_STECR|nr:hypothetical protein L596_023146 [Steinernema carpocapsae]